MSETCPLCGKSSPQLYKCEKCGQVQGHCCGSEMCKTCGGPTKPAEEFAIDKKGNLVYFESRVHVDELKMDGIITYIEDDKVYIKYDEVAVTKDMFKQYFNLIK